MSKRNLVMVLFVLFAAAALSNAANADCDSCNQGGDGGFVFGVPVCGAASGSCQACQISCQLGLWGTECRCFLYSCAGGGVWAGLDYQTYTELRTPPKAESLCQTAAAQKKSYCTVHVEVISARS